MLRNRLLWVAGVMLGLVSAAHGQCVSIEDQSFDSGEAVNLDQFGRALDMDGDRAIVGAAGVDTGGSTAGAAYVFQRDRVGWTLVQKLQAADVTANQAFGSSVAIDGDRVIVGAPGDSEIESLSGAAYVFAWDGSQWIEESKLTASDAAAGDTIGRAVGIAGDVALVSTYSREVGIDDNVGAVYVFQWDGNDWVETQTLVHSDAEGWDFFGWSLDFDGSTAVVGAIEEDGDGTDRGAAYVFANSGGTFNEVQKLTAGDTADDSQFGFSVDVAGDQLVVGANLHDTNASNDGAAYIFREVAGNWVEEAQLLGHDTAAFDQFGVAVAIDGDLALVYASLDDEAGSNSGLTFAFRYVGSGWVEQSKLIGSNVNSGDHFGDGLVIEGTRALVGASGFNASRGAVYEFAIPSFALDVQPNVLSVNDDLDIYLCGGVPFNPAALFTVEFGGNPLVQLMLQVNFDVSGGFHLATTVPNSNGLEGNTLTLTTYSLDRFGQLVQSNDETLLFE